MKTEKLRTIQERCAAVMVTFVFRVQRAGGVFMATQAESIRHPYFEEIDRLFYSYRLAQINRRYYTVLLERAKTRNLWTQVLIGIFAVTAAALFSLMPSFPSYAAALGQSAAVLSALAFVASVVAPVFGWNQTVDEITARVHAWHYAERQIESVLRFLRHTAESKKEAAVVVQFADEAYRTADNLPDTGRQDMDLTKSIRLEVEKAIPPDYVWRAL
jgi:hypothetical protein